MAGDRVRWMASGLVEPTRLDRALRARFPGWGRSAVGALISQRRVQVNGQPVWLASWLVRNGDQIEIWDPPPGKPDTPVTFDDHWLIAQEADLIAVSKPAGLLCHPTRANRPGDLLSLATARFGPLTLAHRLDRDTSGVVLLARPGPANRALDACFKLGAVEKEYLALVAAGGRLAVEGEIRLAIGPHPIRRDRSAVAARGGRPALTRYRVEGQAAGRELVRLWPKTGRMHQLRVHLAAMGAPILGDRLYGGGKGEAGRLMLHAWRIGLPAQADCPARSFVAPLPADFTDGLPPALRPAPTAAGSDTS